MTLSEFWNDNDGWITAVLAVVLAFAAAAMVDRALARRGRRIAETMMRGGFTPEVDTRLRFVRRLIYVAIVVFGLLVALSQFTGLSRLAASILASGAIAAAIIGFAARQVLANAVAGIMLAVTQPLRVGDWVTFEDDYGVVEDVRLNFTVLRTPSDQRVIIPNEKLASGVLRNETLVTGSVGLDVSVWLAPGVDAERALAALEDETGAGVAVAEAVPWGTRLAVGGDPCPRPSGRPARRTCGGAASRGCGPTGCSPRDRSCSRKGWGLHRRTRMPIYNRRSRAATARAIGMSRTQRIRRRRRGRGRPRNKALLAGMVVGIVFALGGLGVLAWVISVAATAPPLSSLKMRDLGSNSAVYAADRQPLGFITAVELRRPVEGSRIPEVLKQATVAIEDERFYRHKGVDWEGVVRAGVKNITEQRTVQGGSTITMQLVRNLYISNERTYQRKIREAKLAEELETRHDKSWILVKYLNTAPYGTVNGQSAVGAQAASRLYFGKDVSKLTLAEAALIAGLPQAPSIYSPFRAANAARARRDQVLRKMAQLHLITDAQARAAIKQGLGTKRSTYFTRRREKYFFDYVKDQLIEQYGPARVRQGGLRVYTTIDLKKQQEARKAIADKLAGVGPSSAIVTLDPRNGYIEAMASSSDYGQSVFNLAAQGHRQPGSTFKVMALLTALRKGVNPNSTRYVSRSPTIIPDTPWGDIEIKTYAGKGAGPLSSRRPRSSPTTRSTSSSRSTSAPRRSRRPRG